MYRRIMTDKLKFPPTIGESAKALIEGLLQRDPAERLKDPSKIKEHPFFNNLDWDALYNKKIKPPFLPNVVRIPFYPTQLIYILSSILF
jgi:hypothetical protein